MSHRTIEPHQQTAAKIVGTLYVIQMAMAVFADSYVRGRLFVRDDAVRTAQNIVAHERLFRWSIVADLLVYATVVLLVWALWVVLEPVNPRLAALAVFWRLRDCANR